MMRQITWAALAAVALMSVGCGTPGRSVGPAQAASGQEAHQFNTEVRVPVKLNYLLYLPQSYEQSKDSWPLIIFLHGSGERGDDAMKVAKQGPPKMVSAEGRSFPFIIVSPQCPQNDRWESPAQLLALRDLLDDIQHHYRVDPDRVYLTGLSMGGFGSWGLAAAFPDRFAAVAPICGGGDPATAARIKDLPIWVFHGGKDRTVPIRHSQEMVAALKAQGSNVKFTIYPEAGHDSWTDTYNDPALYEWLLAHKRQRR